MDTYKRQYRELSPETKLKISQKMKNRPKTDIQKQRISQSMKDYWSHVPSRPCGSGFTTYQEEGNGENDAANGDDRC